MSLLDLLPTFGGLCVNVLELSAHVNYRHNYLFFPNFYIFYFFPCLTALFRTSRAPLIINGENVHPSFFLILGGNIPKGGLTVLATCYFKIYLMNTCHAFSYYSLCLKYCVTIKISVK